MRTIIVAFVCVSAAAATARAQERDDAPIDVAVATAPTARAAEEGAFLSMALAPRAGTTAGFALGLAGYDGAANRPRFDSAAEVRLWRAIALRGGAGSGASGDRMRPNVGVRAQLLRQERHGLDGSLAVAYKAEGFTEPEGEIEATLSAGARFGATSLLGNLAYGQDPEGNERDGEIRAAAFRTWRALNVGVESRARVALGPQHGASATREPKLDVAALPFASVVVGPIAVFGEAGASMLQMQTGGLAAGILALGGVGAAF